MDIQVLHTSVIADVAGKAIQTRVLERLLAVAPCCLAGLETLLMAL
jgi:hypothetical protein